MKSSLKQKPKILKQFSDMCNVSVYPCVFIVHLGASPDGKVFDPTPPFGLVEVLRY